MYLEELEPTDLGNKPYPFNPWRRFFARSFDMFVYSTIWLSFLELAFHINIDNINVVGDFLIP